MKISTSSVQICIKLLSSMTSTSEATPIETLTHDPNPDPVGDVTKPYPIPGHAALHSESQKKKHIYLVYIIQMIIYEIPGHRRLGAARISISVRA